MAADRKRMEVEIKKKEKLLRLAPGESLLSYISHLFSKQEMVNLRSVPLLNRAL